MPTYPTKLVALKTVLLFLWKSKFTVKGFSSSVITQVLLFIFHLKKTNVGDIKDRDGVERRHYIGAACLCLDLAMKSKMTSTLQSSCIDLPRAGITGLRFHVWLISALFACSLTTNFNKIFMSVLWFGSEMSLKGSFVQGPVLNALKFRGEALGRDRVINPLGG